MAIMQKTGSVSARRPAVNGRGGGRRGNDVWHWPNGRVDLNDRQFVPGRWPKKKKKEKQQLNGMAIDWPLGGGRAFSPFVVVPRAGSTQGAVTQTHRKEREKQKIKVVGDMITFSLTVGSISSKGLPYK